MNRFRSISTTLALSLALAAPLAPAQADAAFFAAPEPAPPAPVAPVAPPAPPALPAPLSADIAGAIDRAQRAGREQLRDNAAALAELAEAARRSARSALDGLDLLAYADAGDRDRGGARDSGDAGSSTIDERRPLNADGRVYVNNVAGSIDVATWDRNEVVIGGTLGSSNEKLEISGDPGNLSVVVRMPKRSRVSGDTVLKLRVPASARVELESVSADVAVDGARGPVKVNTVSGDVGLALASPEVTVQTVSGDLKLRSPSKLTKINSVSGDLRMSGLQGKLTVETVSGNVELDGGKFSELRLKSISGDMRLDVSLTDPAQINGETLSGEIHMIVPTAQTGVALVKSFSGEASCDGANTVEHQSGRKREYTWGDGRGARIELSSFSGDIRIERK